MYPMVDAKLTDFLLVLRHLGIPVTLSLMQTRAQQVAVELDIPQFKASRGPSRTYLTQDQNRDDTRGTDLQVYKQRFSVVFCVNADGSHKLPMRYIAVPKKPMFFHVDDTHYHQYSCQSRGWMNVPGFVKWMDFWYEEVKQKSQGPYLLILDNCGGHESGIDPNRSDVRIEFLPKNSTTCAQPLDAGVIATEKGRYRKRYLMDTVHVVFT